MNLDRKRLSLAVLAIAVTCALMETPGWSQQPVRVGPDPSVLREYRRQIDGPSLPAAELLFIDFQVSLLREPSAARDRLREHGVADEDVDAYLQFSSEAMARVLEFQQRIVTENCEMLPRLEDDPAYAIERFVLTDSGAAELRNEILGQMPAEFSETTMDAVTRRIESLRETSSSEGVDWDAYLRDPRIDSLALLRAMCSRPGGVN